MLVEIYVDVDDFCQRNHELIERSLRHFGFLNKAHPCNLTPSEVMTILIYYHLMPYKNFKKFYLRHVQEDLQGDFPDLVSYSRFCQLIARTLPILVFYLLDRCRRSALTGIYFIDSTPWKVCHVKRAHCHRVMIGFADWGKSSMGWFFGLKIHLVINNLGELMSFSLTPGNVADNNFKVLYNLLHQLSGWCFGDRGYLLHPLKKAALEQRGRISLFAKCRKNMKKQDIPFAAQSFLGKRGLVESVIGLLKTQCDVVHSRHRSPYNAMCNCFAGLCAYTFFERKPKTRVNLERRMLPPVQTKGLGIGQ